jgi:hypothetical protein
VVRFGGRPISRVHSPGSSPDPRSNELGAVGTVSAPPIHIWLQFVVASGCGAEQPERPVDRMGPIRVLSNPGSPLSGLFAVGVRELIGLRFDLVCVSPHHCGGLPTFQFVT